MIKLKKIKFNPILVWHLSVIVFLVLFVAILLLNMDLFTTLKEDTGNTSKEYKSTIIMIEEDVLEEVLSSIKKRKDTFDKIFLNKPYIKAPSSL